MGGFNEFNELNELTPMSRQRLQRRINRLSIADEWRQSRREWNLYRVSRAKDFEHCLCGHPIKTVCVIHNPQTDKYAIVGNCCIRQFGIQTSHLFSALKEGRLNEGLIELASDRRIINEWERGFCLDNWRRRRLSPNQRPIFDKLRNKILFSLSRP